MRHLLATITLLAALAAATAPAAAQIAVMGNTLQERATRPGERYTGTILVLNPTAEPQTARLYQTDYRFQADGTSHFDAPGSQARSNAQWVTLGTTQVTIPPGQTVPVQFSVQVPLRDTLHGTYWSVIMVEGLPRREPPRVNSSRPTVGIVPVLRYGVQVVSQMERSGARNAEFAHVQVVQDKEGTRSLQFEIRNAGQRAYRVDAKVQVFDEAGSQVASFARQENMLYPGSSVLASFKLPKLPPQSYQVLVVADTGEDEVFGGQFTLRM